MATYIYSPANEVGKPLVPVGTPKTRSSIATDETIDISWLDTTDTYTPEAEGADTKVVVYKTLESAVKYVTTHSMNKFKFKVCSSGIEELPKKIQEDNIEELRSTIYLVAIADGSTEKNKYTEYVCNNTDSYDEQEKTPVDATYEELGGINYTLPSATGEVKGGVQLLDTPDQTKTADSGWAATPKAIYDLKEQIQSKSTTFTVNNQSISDGDSLTFAGTDPLSVETTGEGNVTITFKINDASAEQKGVAKLYTSADEASSSEDGSLTAKATLDEIKKVDDKVTGLTIPKVTSDELTIESGKITISKTNIHIISVFVENNQFYPQVVKTESAYELTFYTEEDEHYNDSTKATVNYIEQAAE